LLLGDAAHAIVPFHGQGMNAAFEDCRELDALVARHRTDWDRILTDFEADRRANTEAIAEMALENYVEMRDGVRDPGFEQKQAAAFELERRYPGRFVPRYSMVMFHPEIDYAEARRRGRIQADIIEQATSRAGTEVRVDLERASRLVEERL
jgi:kynurenine 3-monooxygenase